MTIGYDDVRKWDADELDASAATLRGKRDKLVGLQDELDTARRLPDWHGAAGENARSSLGDTRNKAETLTAELSAVERALQSASDDVSALKTRVSNNDSLANSYQFSISADGTVVDNKPADNGPAPGSRFEAEERAAAQRHRQRSSRSWSRKPGRSSPREQHRRRPRAGDALAQDGQISDHGAATLADAKECR